jgi:hypothetical protein
MAYESTNNSPKEIRLTQQNPSEFDSSLIYTENLCDINNSLLIDYNDENVKVNTI